MTLSSPSPAAAEPHPTWHRFFFALKPDEEIAARTHDFALAELGPKGLLRREHHHLTLALTEDLAHPDPAVIAALRRAGARVQAAPFRLSLDRLVATRHTLSLRPTAPVAALQALQSAIAAAMAEEGVALRTGWRFDPHETLAYRKAEPGARPVPGFCWSVTAFTLVHSQVGLHRHETIGTWPLGAGDTIS